MTYDTQIQADRLAIRQGLWLAQQPFAGHANYGSGSFKKRRILLGNDSLTNGAGTVTSSFRTTLKSLLDPKYGDPGIPAGWVDETAGGLVTFSQTGASGIASLPWNDASRIKSPFGGGRYVLNATANSFNFFATTKDTDIVAVSMWVEFTAAGQSFNIKQASAPGATTLITISGDNYPLNTPVKITFPLNATYDSGLTVNTINTNGANYIYFWWREFHYATPRAGVELVNVGIGGTKIADWAGLDDAAMRRWLRITQPDLLILNTGMNDRGTALSNGNVYADKIPNAVVFAKNLETVLDRVPQSVKGMLVIPNEPGDIATTAIGYYPDIIKAAATQRGWAWHDDRAVLGNYAAALASGYMDGVDNIHPTPSGNAARGTAYEARIQAAIA